MALVHALITTRLKETAAWAMLATSDMETTEPA